MKFNRIVILFTIFQLFCTTLSAQKAVVFVRNTAEIERVVPKRLLPKRVGDTTRLQFRLGRLQQYCQRKGFVNFAIDSVREDSAAFRVYPFLGRNYAHAVIKLDSSALIYATGLENSAHVRQGCVPFVEYADWSASMMEQMENKGYPFAQISLNNLDFQKDTIGSVSIVPNQFITFDSIIVRGNLKLNQHFLRPYLNWKRHRRYSERAVSQIPQRLQQLPYVQMQREPGVEFVNDRAFLYLFLDKQRVNQFDGYIGFVPVSTSTGGILITGEVNLNLQNIFTIGERISLKWQAPERYSQYLSIQADFPYLFATPLGVSGSFLLDKKDTTYLNMNYLIALQYAFSGQNRLETYFNYATSSVLLSQPQVSFDDSTSFDYHKAMYGVRLAGISLDDVLSPRRGLRGNLDLAVGSRTILKRGNDEETIYDGIDLKSVHYRIMGELTGYVPIGKRWGWVAGLQAATTFGGSALQNDLFRIGGTKTLQGFDEFSIYASSYAIGSTEFRFWFAKQSFINVFFNAAWYERRMSVDRFSDFPFGFGLGATFHTKAGNLYISYALGQQKGNPVSFKTGKIHFGLDVKF